VFRHCSDVLRRQRQGAERVQRAAQLAAALQEMLSHSPLSVSCLLDLQRELQALEDGREPLAECRILLDQADTRLRQESEARHSLQACKEEAAELAAECTGAACPDAAQLQQWDDRYSALAQQQARLPDWLGGKAACRHWSRHCTRSKSRLAALAADNTRIQACEQFLSELAVGSVASDAAAAWEALPKPIAWKSAKRSKHAGRRCSRCPQASGHSRAPSRRRRDPGSI